MARVLVLGTRPYHLTAEEADAWMRAEAAKLAGVPPIRRVELVVLRDASEHFSGPWHWMLELHLFDGADSAACLERGACSELLMDLRLLGMRPSVVVLGHAETLEA
jgi:hypothetical protein